MKALLQLIFAAALVLGVDSISAEPDERTERRKKLEDELDYTKGTSDVCPVHKIKMPAKSVPMTFGLDSRGMDGLRQMIEKEFPFSFEEISGGCVVNNPEWPTQGKRFVCPKCVAGWKLWKETSLKKANEQKSK